MAGLSFNNVGFIAAVAYAAAGLTVSPRVYCLDNYTSPDYVQ